jgi:hypothetical protein
MAIAIGAAVAADRWGGRRLAAAIVREWPSTRGAVPEPLAWLEALSRRNHGLNPVRPEVRVRRGKIRRKVIAVLRPPRKLTDRAAKRAALNGQTGQTGRKRSGHAPRIRRSGSGRKATGSAGDNSSSDLPSPGRLGGRAGHHIVNRQEAAPLSARACV